MLPKKYYYWVMVLGCLLSMLFFLFLQFVYYFDLTSQHFLLHQDYSWKAHWELFTKSDNIHLFIFCCFIGILPVILMYIFDKWRCAIWK